MTRIYDADGTPMARTRDGDLIPDLPDAGPGAHLPSAKCGEPGHSGFAAPSCPCCWSEVKAGDRPRVYVGHRYPDYGLIARGSR